MRRGSSSVETAFSCWLLLVGPFQERSNTASSTSPVGRTRSSFIPLECTGACQHRVTLYQQANFLWKEECLDQTRVESINPSIESNRIKSSSSKKLPSQCRIILFVDIVAVVLPMAAEHGCSQQQPLAPLLSSSFYCCIAAR